MRLVFTLRLQSTFKYLKFQIKQVLSQTLSTKPHRNFMFFLIRRSRNVITNIFKNTLLQWKFAYIYNGKPPDVESSARGYFVKKNIFWFRKVFVGKTCMVGLFLRDRSRNSLCNKTWLLVDVRYCHKDLHFRNDRGSETTSGY